MGLVRHLKLLGLCLTAVFALVAIAAVASASAAEPEWGRCVAVKSKGHYEDSSCTKEDFKENKAHVKKYKGQYEWLPGLQTDCVAEKGGRYKDSGCTVEDVKKGVAKGKYEKTGGPQFTLTNAQPPPILRADGTFCEQETAPPQTVPRADCKQYGENPDSGGWEIKCEGQSVTGEGAGSNELIHIHWHLIGCKQTYQVSGGPQVVTSKGLLPGEIQFNELRGTLGYVNKAQHEMGVVLEPAASGGLFGEFEWVEAEEVVRVAHLGVGNSTAGTFFEEPGTPGEPNGHDGLIASIGPANEMVRHFTEGTTVQGGSKESVGYVANAPDHLESGQLEVLEGWTEGERPNYTGFSRPGAHGEWEPIGVAGTGTILVEGRAEIKA